MKSPSLAGLLLASLACAHAPPSPSERSEAFAVAGASVELRYSGDDEEAAEQVRRVLGRAVAAATQWGPLGSAVIVTIQPTHRGLEEVSGAEGNPWMRAWARPGRVDVETPRSWSQKHASDGAFVQVLTHELTHCVLFQRIGPDWETRGIPAWFREGMASFTAAERHPRAAREALFAPARLLREDAELVYGTADRAFRFLVARFGQDRVRLVLDLARQGSPFSEAFRLALGVDLARFEREVGAQLAAVASVP